MPRSSRSTKSTAPSPAPIRNIDSEKAHETLEKAEEVADSILEQGTIEMPEPNLRASKGKGRVTEAEEEVEHAPDDTETDATKQTHEERMAKLKQLRQRMNQSTQANRRELIEDHQKQKTTARELARLEKQRKLAEMLREKIDAEETGEDLERKKNWDYTIEDNDRWEAKQAAIREKTQFEYDDTDSRAQRRYYKDVEGMKVDLLAYNQTKEASLGLETGSLVPTTTTASSKALTTRSSKSGSRLQQQAGGSTLYGQHQPSEDAIDRVTGKMNADKERSVKAAERKRNRDEDTGDVTYINEKNKVFNKKINRYFDKYTSEIRANFERGTAL